MNDSELVKGETSWVLLSLIPFIYCCCYQFQLLWTVVPWRCHYCYVLQAKFLNSMEWDFPFGNTKLFPLFRLKYGNILGRFQFSRLSL